MPAIWQIANAATSTATIVDPTGVPASMEIMIPDKAHITDNTAEHIVTDLKFRKILMADKAGKITRAEIKSDPTRFMARTMMTAITIAISRL